MQEPKDDAARLKADAFSGVRWTMSATVVRVAVQLLQVALLARLLPPSEFGKMATVLAIIAVLRMFADAGVSNAIIHRQSISPQQLSSLYWLNVASGTAVAVLALLAGPLVADFFGEAELQPLLALGALYLFLGSTWQQLRALAEKELRFAPLANLEIAASISGLMVSLLIAWQGGGVYALMGGLLASGIVAALLAWFLLASGWRPERRFRLGEIRDFLSFGGYAIGSELLNTFNSQIDVLLGSRLFGAQVLGLYSMPKNLCFQIIAATNPIVTRVGLPVMAQSQADGPLLRTIYLQTLRMTAAVNFPVFVALALFAEEVVGLVFGPQWQDAVPLLRIFACWALARSAINPVGSLLMGCGRADLAFKWNLAWLPVYLLVLLGAAQFGSTTFALALCALAVAALLSNWYVLVRPLCGAACGEYFGALALPFVLAVGSALVAAMLAAALDSGTLRLVLGLAVGAAAYMLLSAYFNRSWLNDLLLLLKLKRV